MNPWSIMRQLSAGLTGPEPREWPALSERSLVVALALAIDLLWGEPPARMHPVVWMGRLISAERRRLPGSGPARQLVAGGVVVATNAALAAAGGAVAERLTARLSGIPRVVARGAILSALMSLRMLGTEAGRVMRLVERDDSEGARQALRSLVSRDVATLDTPLLLAAAIESVTENASDSVIAPLLAYVAGGLPGAALYRMANTMDAMLGYRGDYEYLGKAAARFDDLLNWLPARATAGLLALAAPLVGGATSAAWAVARRDHRLTASPNAGWPMSAASGALVARLEKRGHYILGADQPEPDAATVGRAIRLLHGSAGTFVACLAVAGLLAASSQGARRGPTRGRA